LHGKDAKAKGVFAAVVELVEPMGSDSLVWLELGNQKVSARVESSHILKSGEQVGVQFRVEQASLFDAQSGERL
jgi:multiple sugar transport system ATP-binding protein